MGFIEGKIEQSLNNRTRCNTWNDIYESHAVRENNAKLKFEDIKGTLILLSIGLGTAIILFLLENVNYRLMKRNAIRV